MKKEIKLADADKVIRLPFDFCIQCGTDQSIALFSFEETEDNPIAQFAKLAGDFSIVADYVLNKPHKVEAPFCNVCIKKFRAVPKQRQVLLLASLCAIFVGTLVAALVQSFLPIGLSILLFVVIKIYSRIYAWQHSPNITKVNKRKLILKIPKHGKFVCYR